MNSQTSTLITVGVVFVILLVFYIIAKVRSKRGDMVFTANGWDMTMLLACPVSIFIAWCWGFDQPLNTVQIICLVVAGLCLIGTSIMSIVYNKGVFLDILISIMAKLFVVWLTLIIILLVIVIFIISVIISFISSHNDDDEYIILKYDHALRAYVGYRI